MDHWEQRIGECVYRSHLQALYTDPTVHSLYLGLTAATGSCSTQVAVNYNESVVRSVVMKILNSLGRVAYLSLLLKKEAPAEDTPVCDSQTYWSLQGKGFLSLTKS